MKKLKGFTLVELLAVIVILIILISISLTTVLIAINRVKERNLKKLERSIIEAAELYVTNDKEAYDHLVKICKSIKIPLVTLRNTGYLTSNLVNPVTNKKLNLETELVEASMNCDGEIVYQYNDTITGVPRYTCNVDELPEAAEKDPESPQNQGPSNNLEYIKQYDQTYIFKGANPNNYVRFTYDGNSLALWRIISIEKSGSLKIMPNFNVGTTVHYEPNIKFNDFNAKINNATWVIDNNYCREIMEASYKNFSGHSMAEAADKLIMNGFSIAGCKKETKKYSILQLSDIYNAFNGGNYLLNIETWLNAEVKAGISGNPYYRLVLKSGVIKQIVDSSYNAEYFYYRPILTLDSAVKITGGKGTESEPFTLEKK